MCVYIYKHTHTHASMHAFRLQIYMHMRMHVHTDVHADRQRQIVVHYTTIHGTTSHYKTMDYVTLRYIALQYITLHSCKPASMHTCLLWASWIHLVSLFSSNIAATGLGHLFHLRLWLSGLPPEPALEGLSLFWDGLSSECTGPGFVRSVGAKFRGRFAESWFPVARIMTLLSAAVLSRGLSLVQAPCKLHNQLLSWRAVSCESTFTALVSRFAHDMKLRVHHAWLAFTESLNTAGSCGCHGSGRHRRLHVPAAGLYNH